MIGYVAHYTHLAFSFSLIMALMLVVGAVSLTLDLGRSRAGRMHKITQSALLTEFH